MNLLKSVRSEVISNENIQIYKSVVLFQPNKFAFNRGIIKWLEWK